MIFDTTYLAIDLDVIDENFAQVRQKTGCKILTIVKADAYGFGAVPMAKYLADKYLKQVLYKIKEDRLLYPA